MRPVMLPRMAAALGVVIVLACLSWLYRQGQPMSVAPAKAATLPCVSYAPFRREGHTPFDETLVVAPAQIDEDLRILTGVTRCVRSYGVDHGLDALPAAARRLGMRVVLGAWIGRDAAANARQVDRALALAAAHPDTVAMCCCAARWTPRRSRGC
jgi:exo-beta-1,3-glucanase (GH17 family)